jgi:hypothetical protein
MFLINFKRLIILLISKTQFIFYSLFINYIKINNTENIVILCKGESIKLITKKKLLFKKKNFSTFLCNFKNNDFKECKGYKIFKRYPIFIFANGSEPVLNLSNLINCKLAGVYVQRFGSSKKTGLIRNINEKRSVRKLDKISNNVKYLPLSIRKDLNFIQKKLKKKFSFNLGLASILLAASMKPSKIKIFGLDFYQNNYFNKALLDNMDEKEKKILANSSEKFKSTFLEIVKINKNIKIELYTFSDIKSHLKNLKIFNK